MEAKHPHPGLIREQHPSKMAQGRGAVDVQARHAMAAAFVTPPRRAAGNKYPPLFRLAKCNGIVQFDVLKRGGAQGWDLVERGYLARSYIAGQAVLAVGNNRVELMAKDL